MDDRKLLTQMEGHMARGNEHLARGNELMGQIREEVRLSREEMRMSREQRVRSDEALDRHAQMYDDLRAFSRDMMRRMERVTQAQVDEIRGLGRAVEMQTQELRDVREQSRAQRNALLRLLDRFDGPQPGGSSAPA